VQRWKQVLAVTAGLAMVAGACGDDDDDAGTADTAVATTGAETTAAGTDATGGGEAQDSIKVAFVYVGPVGDAGWTKKHDDGRKAMVEALGDKVEVSYLESVPEGAESQRVFENLVREGNDLIFATSFGYMDQMLAVAEANPDVCFEHATGFKTAPNMGTYFGAAEEARYLSGIAAGNATQNGQIGYVAAFPIPEVLRGINAFTLGARSVNPEATVQVVWTSTWFNPETEKQAAESLLDTGVDVIAQHQDTPSPGEAANEAGAKWVGYNDDMSRFAPEAWLTAPVWDWGPYYTRTAEAVLGGSCPVDQYYGNMADGLVGLAPFGESVDAESQALIAETQAKIVDGSFAPFTGPINDQSGAEKIPAGTTAELGELLSMDYLVEGVVGEIPEG
jgi:basic membrane protein A and related proteins